jgi:phage tail sheath protein FI
MSVEPAELPGVTFAALRSTAAALSLRTDVAMFAGHTRRGPVAEAVRVDGWRRFLTLYGGLSPDALTSYAVKGYFDNGGEVAWIWRLGSGLFTAAERVWDLGSQTLAAALGLNAYRYVVTASSPGSWGDAIEVSIVLRRKPAGPQLLDIFVTVADEPPETLIGVPCADLVEAVAARSTYIRLRVDSAAPVASPGPAGPLTRRWTLRLAGGTDPDINYAAYELATEAAALQNEPALFCLPDLPRDLADDDQRRGIIAAGARDFSTTLDRMMLVDLPESIDLAVDADAWLSHFGERDSLLRAAAAYHPWIMINDPLGSIAEPQRRMPPSGHVAGIISRLDRERGAAITPANTSIEGAVDLSRTLPQTEQAGLHALGINALMCQSGRGLVVWGGRMLGGRPDVAFSADTGFIAHRRLIHRLVRAIRQTALPLVFEVNGPQLWFALTRGATTVLLEAWRARALKGTRPEEAFRVRCDAELNSPEVIERGQVVCEVSLAPAVPMEFITIRVALSADGQLEVAEP